MGKNIYIPTNGSSDWRQFLADPEKQWRKGFSARTMANSWEDNEGFPKEVNGALKKAGLNLDIILAIPEYKVDLDTGKAPSQNDLFVLAKGKDGFYVIMVEGKVSEEFGPRISKWYNDTPTRKSRLDFLLDKLEIKLPLTDLEKLYYQLFHRTASAIIIAEKFNAKGAIMLVHSFSQEHKWFSEYADFISALSSNKVNSELNEVNKIKTLKNGTELFTGWVTGDKKYLEC